MAFTVKTFKEVVGYTKEKLDEALAPVRARAAKAKANMAVAEIEENMITLEREIHEACAERDLDFDKIISKIDRYELAERRLTQINKLVADLFPEES